MNYRYFALVVLLTAAVAGGCRSGLLTGDDVPAVPAPAQPATPAPASAPGSVRTSYADIVEKASPAVVMIESAVRAKPRSQVSPFGDDFFRGFPGQTPQGPQLQRGVGSGVIVSADGSILTNAHVVEGAERVTIHTADGRDFDAKVVGTDKPSDLAVLKIEAQNLPFLTLGNSDAVRVGDIVLAIGNPLGIGQTVTSGIISAKGRSTGLSDGQSFEDFLQTDAPINRGNSGGALVDLTGELIGINSQILSPPGSGGGNIGIGFSIPSNMAKSVMEQLLKDGRVRRGKLGVNIQNLTSDTAAAMELKDVRGVLVSNVQAGSAGEKAGLKRGDVITAVNGEKVETSNMLRNKIAGTMPGTEVKLTVYREGASQEMTATLDEFDSGTAAATGSGGDDTPAPGDGGGKLGMSLQPLTPEMAKQLQIPDGTSGLVVAAVDPSGPASDAGLIRGDVILEIDRKPVQDVESARSAIESAADKPLLLLVSRRGQVVFITVRAPK